MLVFLAYSKSARKQRVREIQQSLPLRERRLTEMLTPLQLWNATRQVDVWRHQAALRYFHPPNY